MNREFTHWLRNVRGADGRVFMRLALLLVVCMTSIGGWAENTVTFNPTSTKSEGSIQGNLTNNVYSASSDYADLSISYTGTTSKFEVKDDYFNIKASKNTVCNVTIKVTPKTGYTISNVDIAYENDYDPTSKGYFCTTSTDSETGVLSVALSPTTEKELNARITSITATYTTDGGTTPSADKTFDAVTVSGQTMTVDGTLDLSKLVSATENKGTAVEGATISYKITSGDCVSLSGSTLTANKMGDAVITATISKDGYTATTAKINVKVSGKTMTVSAKDASVVAGSSIDAKDYITVSGPADYTITLSTTDNAVTIDGTTITGKSAKEGVEVSYTVKDDDGKYADATGTLTVNVTEAAKLPTPVITISNVTVTKNYTFEPKVESVVVTLADGTTKMLTDYDITYVSAETKKITVSEDGKSLTTQDDGDEDGVKVTATVKGDGKTYGDGQTTFLVKILRSTDDIVVTIPSEKYTIYTGDANSITVSPQLMATNGPVAISAADVEYSAKSGSKFISFTTNDNGEIEITGLSAGTAEIQVKVNSVTNRYSEGRATFTVVVIDAANTITDPTLSPATGSVELSGSSEGSIPVTITNTYEGATVYYTTDGSDPATSSTREAFKSTSKGATVNLTLTSSEETTKTIRAIAVATIDGVTVSSDEVGGAYTFYKKAATSKDKVTQSFKGSYDAGDRIESPSITMIFGGVPANQKDNTWDEFTKTKGKDNTVGTDSRYTVTSDNDALVEATPDKKDKTDGSLDNNGQQYEYKHYKSSDAYSVSERVAGLPVYGDYFKFEPTIDGTLTLHAQQQGSIYTDGKDKNNKKANDYTKIRLRPVYFVDETGIAQKATNATTKSRLDSDWKSLSEDGLKGSDVNTSGESMYTTEQMKNIYNFFVTYLKGLYMKANNVTEISDVTVKDAYTMIDNSNYNPIFVLNPEGGKTFTAPNGTTDKVNSAPTAADYTATEKGLISTLQSYMDRETVSGDAQTAVNDGTGYFLMTEGYVDYTFNVKAGKTYYFFGNRTKLGLAGFEFQPTGDDAKETITLAASTESDNTAAISGKGTVNATVNRKFTKGYWYSLVLPFSVSTTQLHSQLCDVENTEVGSESELPNEKGMKDVQILYFDRIDGGNLYLHRYFHQMIPAGTPVFIRANKSVTSLSFSNVLVEAEEVIPVESGSYKFNGSYDTWYAEPKDLIMLNSQYGVEAAGTGQLMFYTGSTKTATGAMTATIRGCTQANPLQVIGMGDDEGTSGIVETIADTKAKGAVAGNDAIYNINGQLVGHGLELYTLPKGIYITGGKKHIVR